MRKPLLLAAFAFLAAGTARAESRHEESLEWRVDRADRIVLAEVTATRDTIPPDEGAAPGMSRPEFRLTKVRVTGALKGKPPKETEFDAYKYLGNWPRPVKTPFLLFLDEEGKVEWAVDLDSKEWCKACTAGFKIVRGREALLAAVRDRISAAPSHPAGRNPRPLVLEIPEATDAFKDLFSGSVCYLTVPPEPAFRKDVLEAARSRDSWERGRAAWNLFSYPDEETKGILRTMLKDDGESHIDRGSGAGRMERIAVWPARQAAYDVLMLLGEKPQKPKGYRDDLDPGLFQR